MSKINKHIKNKGSTFVKESDDSNVAKLKGVISPSVIKESDDGMVNLEYNITSENLFNIIKNRKEDLYLNDYNTTFGKKKQKYDEDSINNFLASLCIDDLSTIDLQNITNEINVNKDTYTKNNYKLSTLKYRFCNYLNFRDLLLDGFFDSGYTSNIATNSNYSTDINNISYKNLILYKNQNRYQTREIIIINKNIDPILSSLLKECEIIERNNEIYKRILEKILKVIGNNKDDNKFNNFFISYSKKYNTNIIKLGNVRFGLDRHKSILFKYLCDNIGLNCCIVRKNTINNEEFIIEDHCWNLIQIDNNKLVVDFRFYNGNIIEPLDNFTKEYYKINLM